MIHALKAAALLFPLDLLWHITTTKILEDLWEEADHMQWTLTDIQDKEVDTIILHSNVL